MCLIFFSINNHPTYKLIVAANRDEFYNRKTAPANYWEDNPKILGGRDLEAGGTWMGITKSGRISLITNYRDSSNINPQAPSRGQLVSDYLDNEVLNPVDCLQQIEKRAKAYNGFNLVVGNPDSLWYFSNYGEGIKKITSGLFGLSNHLLETPWPKVMRGKEQLKPIFDHATINTEDIFKVLYDSEQGVDENLPDTGVGIERERVLSSMFIKSTGYGTRCSTILLIDKSNHVSFLERIYNLTTFSYTTESFQFAIR